MEEICISWIISHLPSELEQIYIKNHMINNVVTNYRYNLSKIMWSIVTFIM